MISRTLSAVVMASAAASALAQFHQPVEKLVGKPIPAFSMTTPTGQKITSQSLKGKAVILDFWANYCAPCKAASPSLQVLQIKYGDKGLRVIGANTIDPASTVARYQGKHVYTYTFTHGNQAYAEKLGIKALPVFMFIDKKGIVRRVETGFLPSKTPALFEATVKKLL